LTKHTARRNDAHPISHGGDVGGCARMERGKNASGKKATTPGNLNKRSGVKCTGEYIAPIGAGNDVHLEAMTGGVACELELVSPRREKTPISSSRRLLVKRNKTKANVMKQRLAPARLGSNQLERTVGVTSCFSYLQTSI